MNREVQSPKSQVASRKSGVRSQRPTGKKLPTTDYRLPTKIVVGLASCGIAAGAQEVMDAFGRQLKKMKIRAELTKTGCIGLCYREVLVDVITARNGKITYGNVTPDMVSRIVEQHLKDGQPVTEWIVLGPYGTPTPDSDFLTRQTRIALRNCGQIDPEAIDQYLTRQGYRAIKKVIKQMSPEKVISTVKESGLRGRGGAGFPTGLKWEFTRKAEGDQKYIICNADEGDPGAFMDRGILEGDPHSVLEGMLIAGYAIGANQGYIYVRAEYPLAIHRLKIALEQAYNKGFLGQNLFGSGFDFDIEIFQGAGAFVCGESTALVLSIEGKRGMPKSHPRPSTAEVGLWDKPTCLNNVETFANVPWIILNGADKYSSIGTEKSKGTKVFALTGKVKRGGLVEVPMGITLREIIFDIGGGIKDNGKFKAVQIGGPSGGCLPSDLLDTPVDYESLTEAGAMMGSGGIVVADDHTCAVDLVKFFLTFNQNESCGKCIPCRLGTKRMLEIVDRITKGTSEEEDLQLLENLARNVRASSLCGLGQSAPNPVLTTLKYFKDECDAHVSDKRCFAGTCVDLIVIMIKDKLCNGCGVCRKHCPTYAIVGTKKEVHHIDQSKCTKCGICIEHCPFDAIYRAK